MEQIMDSQSTSGSGHSGSALARAAGQAMPIVLGYIPVGFAYGVLALKNGLDPLNTVLMSLLVFAGSAQLIAVGMFGAGIAPLAIVATTFVVNLRHMLMSAAMSPYLKSWRKRELAAFSYQLTDETFALHATRFARGDTHKAETFWINSIAQASWVTGSLLGVVASTLITDVRPIGLDYALPAMFIALLVGQLKDRAHLVVAVIAAVTAVALKLMGVTQACTILATVIAATLGLGVDAWIRKQS
ncbi:MAG TPA: AzlC family ABC transporter permease [Desulfomicrobiaceae bacterium]|nr:AzlC family ABC transporter permease [Desulfomicrobiaceae bacterium]